MDVAVLTHVYSRSVWVETDFFGSAHVMIQHDDGQSEPFCYASFHYDYRYTSNSGVKGQATQLAVALGATEPVKMVSRPFQLTETPLPS